MLTPHGTQSGLVILIINHYRFQALIGIPVFSLDTSLPQHSKTKFMGESVTRNTVVNAIFQVIIWQQRGDFFI
jgi:hypothetical protein